MTCHTKLPHYVQSEMKCILSTYYFSPYFSVLFFIHGNVFSQEDYRLVITKEKERQIYSNHVKGTSVSINW